MRDFSTDRDEEIIELSIVSIHQQIFSHSLPTSHVCPCHDTARERWPSSGLCDGNVWVDGMALTNTHAGSGEPICL